MLFCTFRYRTAAHLHFIEAAAAQLDVSPTYMRSRRRHTPTHPLLPEEASTALNVVTFLFASSGVLSLLFLAVGLVGKLLGWSVMADVAINPLIVLIRLAVAAGYLWTAWLLSERRELGGFLGLGFLGLSIAPPLLLGSRVGSSNLLIPVLGAIGLALSWSYLNDEDEAARDASAKIGPRAG